MSRFRSFQLTFLVAFLFFGKGLFAAPEISAVHFNQVNTELYRSGRPSEQDLAIFKSMGIKTILSLETYEFDPDDGTDEQNWANQNEIQFLSVPMSPLPFDPPSLTEIENALNLIIDKENQPILVHCYSGSDRTGIVIGAYHVQIDHWSADKAISDMRNFGHSFLFYGWDNILYQFQSPAEME